MHFPDLVLSRDYQVVTICVFGLENEFSQVKFRAAGNGYGNEMLVAKRGLDIINTNKSLIEGREKNDP